MANPAGCCRGCGVQLQARLRRQAVRTTGSSDLVPHRATGDSKKVIGHRRWPVPLLRLIQRRVDPLDCRLDLAAVACAAGAFEYGRAYVDVSYLIGRTERADVEMGPRESWPKGRRFRPASKFAPIIKIR